MISNRLSLILSVPFLTLLASGCGTHSTFGHLQVASPAAAAPAVIDRPLYFNFAIKPFAPVPTVESEIGYVRYGASLLNTYGPDNHQWGIATTANYRGIGDFSYVFNLESGKIDRTFVNSSKTETQTVLPSDNALRYQNALDEVSDGLFQAHAPADARKYMEKVSDFLWTSVPVAVRWDSHLDSSVTVAYRTNKQVDILVDVFHVAGQGAPVWFTKARITVDASSSIVHLPLEKANPTPELSCYYVKILPVGGFYTEAIASDEHCAR